MGNHPRLIQEDVVLATTQRTVDRQFLTKPSPLLRNLVGACAARAMRTHPVKLYWLDININHEHMGIAPLDGSSDSITHVIRFKQLFHSLFARELNRLLKREGALFSTPSQDTACLDNESVTKAFEYAVTNPVKDGLVDRTSHWQGFSSYRALAKGENTPYTYIDWTAWHDAGGEHSSKPPETFTKTIYLRFTPLPGTEDMSPGEHQAQIRRRCRELEQKFREERTAERRTVASPKRLQKLDPRSRPEKPPKKRRKPLCRAASREKVAAYTEKFKDFVKAYRAASSAYRAGCADVVFPRGSFKPPLIEATG